jgi:hypothetical protein
MAQPIPHDILINRYVNIPCPSGKHPRSLVTFRNHSVARCFASPANMRGRNRPTILSFARSASTGPPSSSAKWLPPPCRSVNRPPSDIVRPALRLA